MYTVWADGKLQSIPLSLEDAKEFANETNMLAVVKDQHTGQIVYSVVDNPYSSYYIEIECDMPVWGVDTLE